MIQFSPLRALLMIAGLALSLTACDAQSGAARDGTGTGAPKAPKPQPTAERLVERSNARWASVSKADWIAAYDYLTPEQKQILPLAQYLPGKENHQYANPVVNGVLKVDGEQGYVRATALWTPHHPQLSQVKLEPGQTLTQELKMIETWRWIDGDWLYVTAESDTEFLEKHPELLKAPVKTSQAEPVAAPTTAQGSKPR